VSPRSRAPFAFRRESSRRETGGIEAGRFAAETVFVAPIYVSDAYRSEDAHFTLGVMHEFMMICCEQHELYGN
jgi:hypothetical protein